MPGITIVATIHPRPEARDEAISVLSEAIAASHSEDGCNVYALHTVKDDPSKLILLEHWDSEERLEGHRNASHLAEMRTKLPQLLASPSEVQYLADIEIGNGNPAKSSIA
jgi:quinol monooxygenase YgiN